MKVLLCLLSDQHVPNLLSAHHFNPERLVLVQSKDMERKESARHFQEALRLGGSGITADDRCHVQPLSAEDNLASIRQALQQAYDKFPSGEWTINLTGGTKPMSIAAYEFFKERGGKLVYTNVARPSRFIDMNGGEDEECHHRLGIKEFLAGYGFESRKADEKATAAETRARGWLQSARLLAQHASDQDILVLDDQERKRGREKGAELSADRFRFPCDELRTIWLNGTLPRKLTKYEVEFLTGGWLEVFFWDVLSRHSNALGIWDIRLGLEVGRCGDPSGNDFDVAFMHNHGLSMIECKSGSQDHDPSGDILYKVEAVTRQFRALRVRSCLATTATNVLDRENKVKESLRVRADIYQCRILICDQIRELAQNMDDAVTVRRLVFDKTS